MSVVYYLDSSAWVKRYFVEPGSAWMQALFQREVTLASSLLGYVEVAAALARRSRQGTSLSALEHQLQREWENMLAIELSTIVYDEALWLAWNHKLRGADAVHLAAVRQLEQQTGRRALDLVFVTSDRELVAAAETLQIAVTNPAQIT